MDRRQISYTHDGDTFVGRYRVTEHDRVASVWVQFEQHALAAKLGAYPEELVARWLLAELVRAKVAGETASPIRAAA